MAVTMLGEKSISHSTNSQRRAQWSVRQKPSGFQTRMTTEPPAALIGEETELGESCVL